jgi:cytochrome c2
MSGRTFDDIVGARSAVRRVRLSAAMAALNAQGAIWTFDRLDTFLANPAIEIVGTRMSMAGMRVAEDRANLIAYLRTLSATPVMIAATGVGVRVPGLSSVTFTEEQAEAGRLQYARCVRCHGAALLGDFHGSRIGFAPPLTGERFAAQWFDRRRRVPWPCKGSSPTTTSTTMPVWMRFMRR